jgi:hypothetical protein
MARVLKQGDRRPIAQSRQAMRDLRRILWSREALYRQADATPRLPAKPSAKAFTLSFASHKSKREEIPRLANLKSIRPACARQERTLLATQRNVPATDGYPRGIEPVSPPNRNYSSCLFRHPALYSTCTAARARQVLEADASEAGGLRFVRINSEALCDGKHRNQGTRPLRQRFA